MSVQGAVSWVFDTATALNLANQGDIQLQDELVGQCAGAIIFDDVTSECLQNVDTISIGAPITLALNNMSCDELADYLKLEYSKDGYPEPDIDISEISITYGIGDCQSSNYDLSCATILSDLTDNLTEHNLFFSEPVYVTPGNMKKRGWVYGDVSGLSKEIIKSIVPTEAALGIVTPTLGGLLTGSFAGVKGLAQSFSPMSIESVINVQLLRRTIPYGIGLDARELYRYFVGTEKNFEITSLSLNMTGSITVDIPDSIVKRKGTRIRVATVTYFPPKTYYVRPRYNLIAETITTNFQVNHTFVNIRKDLLGEATLPIDVHLEYPATNPRLHDITLTIIPGVS
jgi:hypothetical protein